MNTNCARCYVIRQPEDYPLRPACRQFTLTCDYSDVDRFGPSIVELNMCMKPGI